MHSPSTTLHLIRHAQSLSQGAYIGHTDVPCATPTYFNPEQAEPLFNQNASWFCSDLQRAKTTCSWLHNSLKIDSEIFTHRELREQNFGEWEGQGYDAVYKANPEIDWYNPALIQPPGGETLTDVIERVSTWLPKALDNKHAIIVAHAGSIRAIIARALNLSAQQALLLNIDAGGLSCISYYDTVGVLEFMNRPLIKVEK